MYQFFRLFLVVSPLQGSFAFATVWSIGGTCDSDSRIIFDTFLRETLAGKSETNPVPKAVGKWECPFEEKGLVYDYVYEVWFLASTLIEENLYSLSGMKIELGGYFNFIIEFVECYKALMLSQIPQCILHLLFFL